MMKRINITINEDLLNRIDSFAKENYLSRSGLISLVVSTYLTKRSLKGQYAGHKGSQGAVR